MIEKEIERRVGPMQIVIVGVCAAVMCVLDLFAMITVPIPVLPGGSSVYFGVAAMHAFAYWFGVWGAIATYIGILISGLITGMPLMVAIIFKACNFATTMITAVFGKAVFKIDPALTRKRDWLFHIAWTVIGTQIVSGVWGIWSLVTFFYAPPEWAWTLGFASWAIGGGIVSVFILTPILKILSPYVKRTRLYHKGFYK